MFRQNIAAGLSQITGTGNTFCAPCVHHHTSIWFLLITYLHHIDTADQIKHLTGHGQSTSPLAGACFRGDTFSTGHLIVVGHRNGGIGLVRPGGADTFIFIINLHRTTEQLFEITGPIKGRGTPQQIFLQHFIGNVYPALYGNFLFNNVHGENCCQIISSNRLAGAGMQRRFHWHW